MRNECNIIRDLLPLYVENIVSEDTASFVEEHLEGCVKCREELKAVKAAGEIEKTCNSTAGIREKEAEPLRALRRKMRRKRIWTVLWSFLATLVLVGGVFCMFQFVGFVSGSEDIRLDAEFQYEEGAYLNQEFVLHMYQMQDKALFTFERNVYQRDENGELIYDEYGHRILCGYEITVRESPLESANPNNYTMGYAYREDSAPNEDFDFTITIIFKDATVVYSMREEGLFEPQENLEPRYWID